MNIVYKDGLLFTTVTITYKGKTKEVENVVIDTGASHTLISQDEVDEIGIRVSYEDEVVTSYGIGGKEHAFVKLIDVIRIGEYELKEVNLDFTSFKYHQINGLLGLDVLMKGQFNIDLNHLELRRLQ